MGTRVLIYILNNQKKWVWLIIIIIIILEEGSNVPSVLLLFLPKYRYTVYTSTFLGWLLTLKEEILWMHSIV